MLEVADVFRRYGDAYLQRFGEKMLPSQRRAFYDILHCRTAAMGGHVYACDRCGHQQYAYHSSKNRSCPKCQGEETEIWLQQRRQELLTRISQIDRVSLACDLRQTLAKQWFARSPCQSDRGTQWVTAKTGICGFISTVV